MLSEFFFLIIIATATVSVFSVVVFARLFLGLVVLGFGELALTSGRGCGLRLVGSALREVALGGFFRGYSGVPEVDSRGLVLLTP